MLLSWCAHVKFFSFDFVCRLFFANVFVVRNLDAILKQAYEKTNATKLKSVSLIAKLSQKPSVLDELSVCQHDFKTHHLKGLCRGSEDIFLKNNQKKKKKNSTSMALANPRIVILSVLEKKTKSWGKSPPMIGLITVKS